MLEWDYSKGQVWNFAHVVDKLQGYYSGVACSESSLVSPSYIFNLSFLHLRLLLQPTVPLVKDTYGSERRKAKTLNFSIAYGKTVHGLAQVWTLTCLHFRMIWSNGILLCWLTTAYGPTPHALIPSSPHHPCFSGLGHHQRGSTGNTGRLVQRSARGKIVARKDHVCSPQTGMGQHCDGQVRISYSAFFVA